MKKMMFFLASLYTLSGYAQVPEFTKDINKQFQSSNAYRFFVNDQVMYFSAETQSTGYELWKTDGTASGTVLVKDINPGTGASLPGNFTAVGNIVYFTATTPANGSELWKTDGTEQGTVLVKDIVPGAIGSTPTELVGCNGLVFFKVSDNIHGEELWSSDGTEANTQLVKDIYPGSKPSGGEILLALNNMLFFIASDSVHGEELWKTDGTGTGTVLVKDIRQGVSGSQIGHPVIYKDQLFFSAIDTPGNVELWKTDGTDTGTSIVYNQPNNSTSPREMTVSGNYIFFNGYSAAAGFELWKSDGTAAGTVLVKDLDPGGAAYSSSPEKLIDVGGTLFFVANVDNGRELYKSDGTSAGTGLVRDLYPIQTDGQINNMTAVGNMLFFTAHSSPDYMDIELYKSDGTSFGTRRVKDIIPGPVASSPGNLTAFKGKLFFSVNDLIHGNELWESDGSEAGTKLMKDVREGTIGSGIVSMAAYKGGVMFNANTPEYRDEPWRSNGDTAGTKMVMDITTGSTGSSAPRDFVGGGDKVFFTVYPGGGEGRLYVSDGVNTSQISVGNFYNEFDELTYLNGKLFFSRHYSLDEDIWVYESGSSAYRLKQINPNGLGDNVAQFTPAGRTLFFIADDGNNSGSEIWKTDGTSQGTVLVKDIRPGYQDSYPSNLTALDTIVYFTAADGTNGNELWKTDGTSAGTVMVKDITAGAAGTGISQITAGKGMVFFVASDAAHGYELWKSDGTAAGTELVLDIITGTSGSNPSKLTFAGDFLYFVVNDSIHGEELWKSDGTASGTMLVKDILPGFTGSSVSNLTAVRNLLFFSANDSIHGNELWKTDGTASGTVMIEDTYPGVLGSEPSSLTLFGDTLFYAATNPSYGNELWFLYTNCIRADFASANACLGRDIQFTDASETFGNAVAGRTWYFGTGDSSSAASPQYNYSAAGTYNVTLKIENVNGCKGEITKSVTVHPLPVAAFTIDSDTQCRAGNKFTFTNTSTPVNSMVTYNWDFGDASGSTAANPDKTYVTAAAYPVKLVVNLGGLCKDSVTQQVLILQSPATSNIIGKSSSIAAVDTFSVGNTTGSSYVWNVAGGTILSGNGTNRIVVQWTTVPGTATLEVTETNASGCPGSKKTKQVTLQSPPNAVNDMSENGFISVFPNPANQFIRISMVNSAGNCQVILVNSLGQQVLTSSWTSENNSDKDIDVAGLAPGVYTIILHTGTGSYTRPVLIRH